MRLVRGRQVLGAFDRGGGHVDVNGCAALRKNLAVEERRAHGVVVRQHRDHRVAVKCIRGACRGLRAMLADFIQRIG
jgi:hypothetical protein